MAKSKKLKPHLKKLYKIGSEVIFYSFGKLTKGIVVGYGKHRDSITYQIKESIDGTHWHGVGYEGSAEFHNISAKHTNELK